MDDAFRASRANLWRGRVVLAVALPASGSAVVLTPAFLGRHFHASGTVVLPGLVTAFALAGPAESRLGRSAELVRDLLNVRSWAGSRTVDLSALTYVRCWRTATRRGDYVVYSTADRAGVRVVLNDRARACRVLREVVTCDRQEQHGVTA
jgi:hypothetical protein